MDEEATVHRYAEEGVCDPVLVPSPDRWIDMALVVDNWSSMLLWRETAIELYRLLERQGVFRTVRLWSLDTLGLALHRTETADIGIFSGYSGVAPDVAHSPALLNDPSGRRLILVLSDCIAPAWSDGSAYKVVRNWMSTCAVGILHPLPSACGEERHCACCHEQPLRSRRPAVSCREYERQPEWFMSLEK